MEEKYLKSREEAIERLNKALPSLTLMKDYFFTAFMAHNPKCMEVVLRAFSDKNDIEVTKVVVQHVVVNGLEGRGVRFDSRVETKDGTIYNLEIENRPNQSLALRLRYYSAMMNVDNLEKGEDFSKLPPISNIMIMPKDARGKGEAKYYVRRVFVESQTKIGNNPEFFEDNETIILVNALYKNKENFIGKVIHDFVTPCEQEKYVPEIADAIEKFLHKEKERRNMLETIADNGFDGRVLGALVSDAELEKARNEVRAEMNLQLMAIQQEREQERQEHERECQKSERIYNILIDEPENNCEKKFFDIVKHAIKVNKNYTEHNENLAIRDLLKAGFSHDEIADTLGKYSPLVRDKIEIEKNIQDVAEKNKMNSKSSAR